MSLFGNRRWLALLLMVAILATTVQIPAAKAEATKKYLIKFTNEVAVPEAKIKKINC